MKSLALFALCASGRSAITFDVGANLASLTFSATPHDAPSENFDFLEEIHIYVDAPSDATLPKIEVANLAPVPKGEASLRLDLVPKIDLLPYINKGTEISATASGTQPISDFTYDGHVDIAVHI